MLMGSVGRGEVKGILVKMGTSMRQFSMSDADLAVRLTDEQGQASLNYPTNLTQVEKSDFDRIARHGGEVCEATLTAYADWL